METANKKIAVVMGSKSDLPVMEKALVVLRDFEVDFHLEILSAHRTPQRMLDFASDAYKNGFRVIIAAAGGAAHLPGMVASNTILPVIGVPIKSSNSIAGIDSLLSIAQMPGGVPVATMAVDGAKNSALMALQILAIENMELADKLLVYKKRLSNMVDEMNESL